MVDVEDADADNNDEKHSEQLPPGSASAAAVAAIDVDDIDLVGEFLGNDVMIDPSPAGSPVVQHDGGDGVDGPLQPAPDDELHVDSVDGPLLSASGDATSPAATVEPEPSAPGPAPAPGPGHPAEQSQSTRSCFLENAITVTGSEHMLNNLTSDVHKKIPNWDKFFNRLKHFEALLGRSEHKRHLMRAIFAGSAEIQLFERERISSLDGAAAPPLHPPPGPGPGPGPRARPSEITRGAGGFKIICFRTQKFYNKGLGTKNENTIT